MEPTRPAEAEDGERSPRRLPAGMLAMLGVVVLVEALIALNQEQWQSLDFATFQFTRRAIDTGKANTDLLVLGDSVLKLGLQPKVLQERLGLTSYNLAHSGGQAPDTYFALRQALARGARPKAILIDCNPFLLQCAPFTRARETAELRTLYDCLELGWLGWDGGHLGTQLMAKLLPSYRYRETIGGEICAKWMGRPRLQADLPPRFWRNWGVNQGAELAVPNPSATRVAGALDETASLLPIFYPHPLNSAFIKRTLKLATSRGIDVYWLIPPINPQVQARREQTRGDNDYETYIRVFQTLFPTLKIIDGRHANYDPALFIDVTHLDCRGSYVYSMAVADVLERGIGPTRWAEIAQYRQLDKIPPLEDLEKSQLALGAGDALRR